MGTFVQFAGTSCGAGKSTLCRSLRTALAAQVRTVELVEEQALFRLPELLPLGDRFLRKDLPGPDELLDSFAGFLAVRPEVDFIVNDGSWVLLAEDLPWAQASRSDLVAYTRRLQATIVDAGLSPVAFFLDAPPEVAVARARRRDGDDAFDAWIDGSMRHLPALAAVAGGTDVEIVAAWCERVRGVWLDAGWSLIDLPAAEAKEVVLAAALDHLLDIR